MNKDEFAKILYELLDEYDKHIRNRDEDESLYGFMIFLHSRI